MDMTLIYFLPAAALVADVAWLFAHYDFMPVEPMPLATHCDIGISSQTCPMLKAIRSPRFEFGLAALFAALALVAEGERSWLLGIAATAAFWGFINWIGSNKEDE